MSANNQLPLPYIWGCDEEVFPTLGEVKEAIASHLVDHLENCETGQVVHGKQVFNIRVTVELIPKESAK